MCLLCASVNHKAGSCPGQKNRLPRVCKFCSSRGHIIPLCKKSSDNKGTSVSTDVCTNTGIQEQLYKLPIVAITVSRGKRISRLNCLFDTGSQGTYFDRQVVRLGCDRSFLTPVEFDVKTFLGSKNKTSNQGVLGIEVDKGSSLALPVLIDDEFDMNFRFDNFKSVKNNLINLNYKLTILHEQNDVRVHGLSWVDVIQFVKNIKMVDCTKGSAWEFPTSISPFGNC